MPAHLVEVPSSLAAEVLLRGNPHPRSATAPSDFRPQTVPRGWLERIAARLLASLGRWGPLRITGLVREI